MQQKGLKGHQIEDLSIPVSKFYTSGYTPSNFNDFTTVQYVLQITSGFTTGQQPLNYIGVSGISVNGNIISFTGVTITLVHNSLTSIQGGQAGQYFHLKTAEYANLQLYLPKFLSGNATSFLLSPDGTTNTFYLDANNNSFIFRNAGVAVASIDTSGQILAGSGTATTPGIVISARALRLGVIQDITTSTLTADLGDIVSDIQTRSPYFHNGFGWALLGTPLQNSATNGKYLKSNGASAFWNFIREVPDPTGQTGKYLTNNGTSITWGNPALGWGSITGTLFDQADLATALAGKASSETYGSYDTNYDMFTYAPNGYTYIKGNPSATANFTLMIPSATVNVLKKNIYFNASNFNMTITAHVTETIRGLTSIVIKPKEAVSLISDGSNWDIFSGIVTNTSNTSTTVYQKITANYTADTADTYIACTGTFNLTFTAPPIVGKAWEIINAGTGTITFNGGTGVTFNGASTYTLTIQYQTAKVVWDGTEFKIFY